MAVRSVRGAIDVPENTRDAILQAGTRMLNELVRANGVEVSQVVAAFFSATADLNAAAPAEAARALGWKQAALHCFQEMHVEGVMPKCLRVTVLWETDRPQSEMKHCYLGKAAQLRPDLHSSEGQ
ncbi:MAG: chorismate mutase [Anaerolineales bacterium]|nr:chorismate mutase [Anaerolineales bacterium]